MKRRHHFISLLTFFLLFLILNFVASRHAFRFDMTENQDYTLSDATKQLLEKLDDVVTVRLYFTHDLPPALLPLRRTTDDVLDEFKRYAGRKIQIEYIDPADSELDEQKAVMLGIAPVQLNVIENDRREVAKIFLGLAVLFGDKQEVIPVLQQVGNLEYDLAQAILKVSTDKLPTLGWWGAGAFQDMKQLLSRRYQIREVSNEQKEILSPKEYDALVVVSSQELTDDALFVIDQYLMAGGHVIALVDRWGVGQGLQLEKQETKLVDLLMRYGVTVENQMVVDRSHATASFQGGAVTYYLPYAFWPIVRKEGFASDIPFVAGLEAFTLPWTSALTLASSQDERKIQSLASTTGYGVTTPIDPLPSLSPQDANQLLTQSGKSVSLAALVEGKIPSAFGENFKVPKGREQVTTSTEAAKLLVVGSSRFLNDQFLQMFPENAVFFENAVDSFAWGTELIGIRSRMTQTRPIALLSDGARAFIRLLNMIIAPVLVLLIGVMVYIVRRRRHHTLRLAYQR